MSRKLFLVLLLLLTFCFLPSAIKAATAPVPAPVPIACPDEKNPEFNSLRPYQASPCGGSVEARMCSNDLIFTEGFELKEKGDCKKNGTNRVFPCNPSFSVGKHNLFVDLSNTTLPILGNTEQVANSTLKEDSIDDATKMNEYVSWYLNGVNSKAEYGTTKNTGDSLINFSGPIQKIMPQAILDNQRIKTIETIGITSTSTDDTGNVIEEIANHNQIVACASRSILGLIGNATPYECYKNGTPSPLDTYRLADWQKGDLGITRKISSTIMGILLKFPGVTDSLIGKSLSEAWNQRIPPVPWGNGQDGKPFDSYVKYQKARNEWQGKSCVIIPFINFLFCFDLDPTNVFINSDWANLYSYVPLANTVDKKGVELVNGVQIQPSGGTQLSKHGYGETKNAPLFFAHTEEVKNLSEFLNSSYTPKDFKSVPLPKSTEKNVCSAVNVRTNQGDNLFPEATHGIEVHDVYYTISQVECHETFTPGTRTGCGLKSLLPCPPKDDLKCPAEITITIKTDTKSPWLDNIFSTTVADSGSTFRKIFPKVGENAPVTCIADIPGVTNVTYDSTKSQKPAGGDQTFEVGNVPADGGATPDSPQLTFPHLGSVYDYFLKGIQTALRPKGYGEPIESGTLCTTVTDSGVGSCKQWLFEKDSKGQYYYDKVIQAAGSTSCNGKSLNPVWALAIALNENGGLMSDKTKGESKSHFGCNINQIQSIEDKISCMTNTLRNDCVAGKTDEQTLIEYGYRKGYAMWPITVLAPGLLGTAGNPPLFGSANVQQLITNLLNTNWKATYSSQAATFCPNSPALDSTRSGSGSGRSGRGN